MKHLSFRSLFFVLAVSAGLNLASCKNKAKDADSTTKTNVDSNNANTTAPEISSDAALENGVKDATKDYPGVTATVSNGEINVAGTIEREKWIKLRPSLDALSPKKINIDNLIIK